MPFGKNPWWWYLASAVPALLVTILIFMDQQISAVIVNRKENKLKVRLWSNGIEKAHFKKSLQCWSTTWCSHYRCHTVSTFAIFTSQKSCGYHLDLFWVGVLMAVCSFMGLPWYVAATVISIAHIDSLKMESESSAPGEQPQFLGVRYHHSDSVDEWKQSAWQNLCLTPGTSKYNPLWQGAEVDRDSGVCSDWAVSFPRTRPPGQLVEAECESMLLLCSSVIINLNFLVISVHPNASSVWSISLHGSGLAEWHPGKLKTTDYIWLTELSIHPLILVVGLHECIPVATRWKVRLYPPQLPVHYSTRRKTKSHLPSFRLNFFIMKLCNLNHIVQYHLRCLVVKWSFDEW